MKKTMLILWIAVLSVLAYWGSGNSYPIIRKQSMPMVIDGSDRAVPFVVTLTTTAGTQIVPDGYRRGVTIQNPPNSAYNISISTTVSFSTATARMVDLIPGASISFNSNYALYGIVYGDGVDQKVIGWIEYGPNDSPAF